MLSIRLSQLLSNVELPSKAPSRFDAVRDWLAGQLAVESPNVAVKYFKDAKNFRNRLSECLRSEPLVVLALLADASHCTQLIRAIEDRLHIYPGATILLAVKTEGGWELTTGFFGPPLANRESLSNLKWIALTLSHASPSGAFTEIPHLDKRKLSALVRRNFEWTPEECRDALIQEFQIPASAIAVKRISSDKNVHNRIYEALGMGASVLILDAGATRPDARAIVRHQLRPLGILELGIIFGEDSSARTPFDVIAHEQS